MSDQVRREIAELLGDNIERDRAQFDMAEQRDTALNERDHARDIAAMLEQELSGLLRDLRQAAEVAYRGQSVTDAQVMRVAADDLIRGYDAGGSNRRAAIARVLNVVADAIEVKL